MFDTIPLPILTVIYWIHLIATVVWVGGAVGSAMIAFPAWRNGTLTTNQWLQLQQRLLPSINGSMAFLWVTGFVQMTTDNHYNGFLVVDSTWAWAMLLKHIAVIGMMLLAFYAQFQLYPAIRRQQLLWSQRDSADLSSVHRQASRLLTANLIFSLAILLATALATAV